MNSPQFGQGAFHVMETTSLLICSMTGASSGSVCGSGVGTAVGGLGTAFTLNRTIASVDSPSELVAVTLTSIVQLSY